jgi:hypothetical protein
MLKAHCVYSIVWRVVLKSDSLYLKSW